MLSFATRHSSDLVGAVNDGEAVQSIVALLPAAPMVGACVSVAVIVWGSVEGCVGQECGSWWAWEYYIKNELPVVVLESKFTVAPLQSSLAVGDVNDGVGVQSIVALAPAAPMVGACVSVAVIV